MRKTCLVVGYINNNLGDDLFFELLFKRYKNVDFYFYPPSVQLDNYKEKYKKYKNVIFYEEEEYYKKIREDIVDKNTPINLFPMILERAKKVDFYVNIGGSIFIQNNNWKNDDRFIIKEHLGNKPSFIIGCNFGPGDQEYINYYKEWFKTFDDICFRDEKSYAIFKDLDNVRLADDIVLITAKHRLLKDIKYKKNIAISLIDPDIHNNLSKYKDKYYDYLTKTIKHYINKKYNIKLFSFCENDGDLNAINELLNRMDEKEKKHIKVINYTTSICEFLKEWRSNKYVICSRFHSVILAMANYQAFIPLSYSKKTNNFLEKIDKTIKTIDIKDIDKVDIENQKFYLIEKEFYAEKQFEKIDAYLSK